MTSQRSILTLALFATLALALLSSSNAHNITANAHHLFVGARVWGDHLLQHEVVQKASSMFSSGPKEEKTFVGDRHSKITYIQVLDQSRDGNGGSVALVNGGPNHVFATLKFKNGYWSNIHFVVEIYGKE